MTMESKIEELENICMRNCYALDLLSEIKNGMVKLQTENMIMREWSKPIHNHVMTLNHEIDLLKEKAKRYDELSKEINYNPDIA